MLYLIYNPAAGRGRAPDALREALSHLDAANAAYQVVTTSGPGDATALAAAAPASATVVAVGGDGTVHEVVKGLLARGGTPQPLGVLPVGSGDDFAFALGIDRYDMRAAVARMLANQPVRVDVARVGGESVVNALGVGFDAEVAHRLARAPRFLKGLAAYLYAVLVSLGRSHPVPVVVTVDGVEVYRGRSLLTSVQNGPRTGGSFLFAPAARPDDGLLDVVVAGDVGLFGTLRLLPKVMRGRHLGDPAVHVFRGRHVHVRWESERYAHADGESLGRGHTFDVTIDEGALIVLR